MDHRSDTDQSPCVFCIHVMAHTKATCILLFLWGGPYPRSGAAGAFPTLCFTQSGRYMSQAVLYHQSGRTLTELAEVISLHCPLLPETQYLIDPQ